MMNPKRRSQPHGTRISELSRIIGGIYSQLQLGYNLFELPNCAKKGAHICQPSYPQ